jgi:hypothetical protein
MPEPEELFNKIANDLLTKGDTRRGKMFGMPCISVNSKMFAGLHNGDMTFKLGGTSRDEALKIEGARLFDPGMGRQMKEWVAVPAGQSGHWRELADQAYAYVADLSAR